LGFWRCPVSARLDAMPLLQPLGRALDLQPCAYRSGRGQALPQGYDHLAGCLELSAYWPDGSGSFASAPARMTAPPASSKAQTATPTKACFVFRPVRDLELYLADTMATGGIVFEWHRCSGPAIAIADHLRQRHSRSAHQRLSQPYNARLDILRRVERAFGGIFRHAILPGLVAEKK
jgi:hypothetical protein